jgi:hypothetical protein
MTMMYTPLNDGKTVADRIRSDNPRSVLLLFFHGLGDLIMFMEPLARLRAEFPHVKIDVGCQKGMSYETFCEGVTLVKNSDPSENAIMRSYDFVATIHFPMNEPRTDITKGQLCCVKELGIEPTCEYPKIKKYPSRLCSIHYHSTCMPSLSIQRTPAEMIWNEVLRMGWIPIETHFQHRFNNPVNTKYDFVDATVRRCKPDVGTLISLIQSSGAFIGCVSGPFHVATAVLPPERIMLLETDFSKDCFSRKPIRTVNAKNYDGGVVSKWLSELE